MKSAESPDPMTNCKIIAQTFSAETKMLTHLKQPKNIKMKNTRFEQILSSEFPCWLLEVLREFSRYFMSLSILKKTQIHLMRGAILIGRAYVRIHPDLSNPE